MFFLIKERKGYAFAHIPFCTVIVAGSADAHLYLCIKLIELFGKFGIEPEHFIRFISAAREICAVFKEVPFLAAEIIPDFRICAGIADKFAVVHCGIIVCHKVDELIGKCRACAVGRNDHRINPDICSLNRLNI